MIMKMDTLRIVFLLIIKKISSQVSYVCHFVMVLSNRNKRKHQTISFVRKTCPCNVYPLYPTFILKNWGLQGYT